MGVEKGGRAEQGHMVSLSCPLLWVILPLLALLMQVDQVYVVVSWSSAASDHLGVSADTPSSFWLPGFYPALPSIHNNFL